MMTCSTASGSFGLISRGGRGGSVMCLTTTAMPLSASNGTRPVSISCNMQPGEYKSARTYRQPLRLLRGHIIGRAHADAALSELAIAGANLGQPEIGQQGPVAFT